MESKFKNLKIVSNPIVNQSLCTLRSKNTDTEGVRLAARKLTRILLYEATKNLPQKEIEVEKDFFYLESNATIFEVVKDFGIVGILKFFDLNLY